MAFTFTLKPRDPFNKIDENVDFVNNFVTKITA